MARSVSRKSTKKCGPRKHGRKSHMRKGKMIKSTCVKNRKRVVHRGSKGRKMRGFMDKMKAGWNSFKQGYKGTGEGAVAGEGGVAMSAMKSKSKSRSRKAASKSKSKSASRKSSSKSGSRKRVLGTGACTSRKMSECTKDSRCQIRRRPKGGRTCVLGKGWKQVHGEAERLAMIGAY